MLRRTAMDVLCNTCHPSYFWTLLCTQQESVLLTVGGSSRPVAYRPRRAAPNLRLAEANIMRHFCLAWPRGKPKLVPEWRLALLQPAGPFKTWRYGAPAHVRKPGRRAPGKQAVGLTYARACALPPGIPIPLRL